MTGRLPTPEPGSLDERQQAILDEIRSSRGSLEGPFLAWIHSPELAQRAQRLGAYCRYQTSLPPRLSELAILVSARWWGSVIEREVHEPLARDAGLEDAVIQALAGGEEPEFNDESDRCVFEIGRCLYQEKGLDAALYETGERLLGTRGLVDLVGIYGYYALVSMTLKVFLEPDSPSP